MVSQSDGQKSNAKCNYWGTSCGWICQAKARLSCKDLGKWFIFHNFELLTVKFETLDVTAIIVIGLHMLVFEINQQN